ncbi:MAG: carboxypeptidase-like regulatory domain-containing protein, partial [Planctomycetota bacterium]|nr:carboxypeptidase-like regulatory domain-containing protein [Planctomycetota bacterium]
MPRSMWVAIALVAVLVALLFVVDPLGLFKDVDPDSTSSAEFDPIDSDDPGLAGRGTGVALEDLKSYEGEPVGVLDLKLGSGVLTGKVLGEGKPLALARVRAVLPPPSYGLGVRAKPDGTYEIRGLPMGQHEIRVTADEYVGQTVVAPLLAQPRETEEAKAANEVRAAVETVDLARRTESTNAIVVKALDGFGRPLPGANVLATTLQWDLHLSIGPEMAGVKDVRFKAGRTDENGMCRLEGLEPDRYDVAITMKGYITEGIEKIQVTENRTRNLSVRMMEGQSIRGRVVTADGRGAERVYVGGFHLPSFHSATAVFTDANGDFVLDGLRKGNYTLMAFHDDFGQVQSQAVSPGTGVKMKLGGTGTIRLKVEWSDGTPVTKATVRPFAVQMGFGYVYSMVEELDDAGGSCELKLPNGNYAVRVQTPDGFLSGDVKADVIVGETRVITVKIPRTGVVRGVVTDEQGNHIPGVEVYVRRGGFPPHKSREQYARTNADGEFEVSGLTLEPVKLRVSHAGYADTELEAEAKPASEAKELTVRMAGGAVVSGHVKDREGQPIPGRQVTLFENWFEPTVTQTDDDGFYAFRGVSEGTWS